MDALAPADLGRLAKVCGMFGSMHMGERAAAAAKADRIVKDAGLTWLDLLGAVPRATSANCGGTSWRAEKLTPGEILAQHGAQLNGWEKGFLTSLVRRVNWTPRQREILDEIRQRVAGGA